MKKLIFYFLVLITSLFANLAGATTQSIVGGCDGNVSASATNYCTMMGTWAPTATETDIIQVIPTAGSLNNFRVTIEDPPGAGKSYALTIRTGATVGALADTALTCTISGASDVTCSIASAVSVSAGDLITVKSVPSSTPTAGEVGWAVEFTPTTSGRNIILGGVVTNHATATRYGSFANMESVADSTIDNVTQIIPTTGVVSNLYISLITAPGAGNTDTFTLYNNTNASATSVTCNVTETNLTCNDTSNTHTLTVSGSLLATQMVPTSNPTTSRVAFGYVFTPTTTGDFIIIGQTPDTADGTTAEAVPLSMAQGVNWTSNSFGEKFVGMTGLSAANYVKEFWMRTLTDPGAGNSVTYTVNKYHTSAPVDTTIAITYTEGQTGIKSQTGLTVNIPNNDPMRYRTTVVSVPSTGGVKFALLAHEPQVASVFTTLQASTLQGATLN